MHQKIKNINELKEIVNTLKKEGKKIVLANGCLEITHVGHIRYLKEAKGLGDILIVAVNSNESTTFLKGEGRPIVDEKDREEIVASFYFVDYVVIFPEVDVSNLILELSPHIHAKGTDYTEESVPERKVVDSVGGKVRITGDKKSHSDKEIIQYIIDNCM